MLPIDDSGALRIERKMGCAPLMMGIDELAHPSAGLTDITSTARAMARKIFRQGLACARVATDGHETQTSCPGMTYVCLSLSLPAHLRVEGADHTEEDAQFRGQVMAELRAEIARCANPAERAQVAAVCDSILRIADQAAHFGAQRKS